MFMIWEVTKVKYNSKSLRVVIPGYKEYKKHSGIFGWVIPVFISSQTLPSPAKWNPASVEKSKSLREISLHPISFCVNKQS